MAQPGGSAWARVFVGVGLYEFAAYLGAGLFVGLAYFVKEAADRGAREALRDVPDAIADVDAEMLVGLAAGTFIFSLCGWVFVLAAALMHRWSLWRLAAYSAVAGFLSAGLALAWIEFAQTVFPRRYIEMQGAMLAPGVVCVLLWVVWAGIERASARRAREGGDEGREARPR